MKKVLFLLLCGFVVCQQTRTVNANQPVTTATPAAKEIKNFTIKIVSFGYKHGIPSETDMVIDLRCLPNPHLVPELKEKNGLTQEVKNYVLSADISKKFLENLYRFLDITIPMYIKQEGGRNSLIISVGCGGGTQRSVVIGEILKEYLRSKKYNVEIQHRDIEKK